jgi:hypothetical protein
MVSNITAANSAVSELRANITAANASVTATNSAIITANVGMKTYVDTQVASAVIQASSYGNSVVAAYLPVNSTITSIQANVTAANANISVLTTNAASQSSEISGLRANITAANANIASTQSNVTAANSAITGLQSNIAAANVNISTLQTKTQFLTANVGGSVFTNNVYLGEGNLVVGNINASGNLVMKGTDSTTVRFVRSVDTEVNFGEIYGNIDFAGESSVSGAAGPRARLAVSAIDSFGATDFKFYTSAYGTPGVGFFNIPPSGNALEGTPRFVVNSGGFYGDTVGYARQLVPPVPTFTQAGSIGVVGPIGNDESNPQNNMSQVYSAGTVKTYSYVWTELEAAQTFLVQYSGYAGGDRANVRLSLSSVTRGLGDSIAFLTATEGTTTELEIYVQGLYLTDNSVSPGVFKRLRKHWIASISYTDSTGLWTILDQQLREPVYNSDATNWAAGAVNAGKVFLQANATVGSQSLNLRFDAPTAAATTSSIKWQWSLKSRPIQF